MSLSGAQRRRVMVACLLSIAAHVAIAGAWYWCGRLPAGSGAAAPALRSEREIAVTIRVADPPPLPDAAQPGRAYSRSSQGSGSAEGEVVTARRVLDDPATGLVFSVYFKAIRAVLMRQASLETAAESPVRELSVRFVLGRDGRVESVLTPDKTPAPLQRLAERLLERAGPFPSFPSSIPHRSIVFDVLFRFDANVLG